MATQMKNITIKEFSDLLNDIYGRASFNLNNDKSNEAVPTNLTHHYLLRKFQISKDILNIYYLPTKRMFKDDRIIDPYSLQIDGVFYSLPHLNFKLLGITETKKRFRPKHKGKEIKTLSQLSPFFLEYSKGFKDGFKNFENDVIKNYETIFTDKKDMVLKVFEFLTVGTWNRLSWFSGFNGFGMNEKKEIINSYQDGEKHGYFYRAW